MSRMSVYYLPTVFYSKVSVALSGLHLPFVRCRTLIMTCVSVKEHEGQQVFSEAPRRKNRCGIDPIAVVPFSNCTPRTRTEKKERDGGKRSCKRCKQSIKSCPVPCTDPRYQDVFTRVLLPLSWTPTVLACKFPFWLPFFGVQYTHS